MSSHNLVIIVDDQHNKNMLGCYGHPLVQTPNLDRLASMGTRFTNAYTPSPLCVAARASLATGQYVHKTKCWDNATAYDGSIPSWGHRLEEQGVECTTIGKLHFQSEDAPTGFNNQIIPMHLAEGGGDLMGSIRPKLIPRTQSRKYAENVGPGETEYITYDRKIASTAAHWLEEKANETQQSPWVLFVSFICPHFPLKVPQNYYDLYPLDQIPLPKEADMDYMNRHPWWKAFMDCMIFDRYFEDDEHRKRAIASYLGLCTFTDENVGTVLNGIENSQLKEKTRVLFFSDHGDCMGARGIWGKSTMHEESAGIPMIMAGPDVPEGKVCTSPVNLVDVFPTVLANSGLPVPEEDRQLPGRSLIDIAQADTDSERISFSEYHGAGSISAAFMIRRGRFKYVHYTNFDPELFDLETDPEEQINLAADKEYSATVSMFSDILHSILDPQGVDANAKNDQAQLVQKHGGIEAILKLGGLSGTPVPGGSSTRVKD